LLNIFRRSAMAIFTDIEELRDKIMTFGEQLHEFAQYAPDHGEVSAAGIGRGIPTTL
jgi:hypothetical protein